MFLPINLKTVHIDRDIALNKLRKVRWLSQNLMTTCSS
jgi:hypothetical protein